MGCVGGFCVCLVGVRVLLVLFWMFFLGVCELLLKLVFLCYGFVDCTMLIFVVLFRAGVMAISGLRSVSVVL